MTSAINGVTSTGAVGTIDASTAPPASETASSTSSSNSLLDPQAFLKLLVAQLQYQDPTNPVNTSDFMNQTATLSQVQTMASMSSTLSSLATAQSGQEATAMIGKNVSYTDASGMPASGQVNSVQLLASGPMLQVGNDSVALSSISAVSAGTTS